MNSPEVQDRAEELLAPPTLESDARATHEPVIVAVLTAARQLYGTHPDYRQLVDKYVETDVDQTSSYMQNKFFVAHQHLLIDPGRRARLGYPERFTEPEYVYDVLKSEAGTAAAPGYKSLSHDLERPLQTNRGRRAVVIGFLAIALALRQPMEKPQTVYEYGSAAGLVLHTLFMHDPSLEEVIVVDENGVLNEQQSKHFNIYARLWPFERYIGIEAQPPKTEEDRLWIKSSTLSPSQLDDHRPAGGHEAQFDMLMLVKPQNTSMIKGNFLDLKPDSLVKEAGAPADIAFFPHSLSQNLAQWRSIVDNIAMPALKRRGLVAINDYAYVDPKDPCNIIWRDRWYNAPWLCQTIVRDNRPGESNDEYYPVLEWETAECKKVRIIHENLRRLSPAFADAFLSGVH